jgi:nucleoside-diphosphate-sugar epimerase
VRGSRQNLAPASADRRVRIVEGSMLDRDCLRNVLTGADGVFLLASLWLGECVNDPRGAWEVNTLGAWNVIEACLACGVKRVVYSSSASVYGNAVVTPMTEEHPFNNRTTYGATKIANEQMFRAVYEQSKLGYIGNRYMNIYGPRMDYEGVYVSVIMKVLDKIFAGQRPVVFGDGSQTYDFIYVEDVARANVLGMQADCVDECFNIGMGVGTTINELVRLLLRLTGSTLEPEYRPEAQSFVTERIGSTEKAKRLLGFHATVPLDEGLRRVVEWRRSQQ